MKKSTKGFLAGSLLAGGAIAGLYYAKKKGYLDQAINYVKENLNKNASDSDIFEEEDYAVSESDYFTAPETAPVEPATPASDEMIETDKEISSVSDERSYVALDFDTPAEEDPIDVTAGEVPAEDADEV